MAGFKFWNDAQTFWNRVVFPTATTNTTITFPEKNMTVGELDTIGALAGNTVDLSTGTKIFTKTITATTTLAITGAKPLPDANTFALRLTNAGLYPLTWFSGLKWESGKAPTLLTSNGVDIFTFYSPDGGTTWEVLNVKRDVK